ncbi:hypothetical protein RUM43_009900 [Polyplax serrata]|uniref:AD domain-containing protein n=1 Tax=Polyplax serrata TaxID=468196 RepID=A0AAN8PK01_POLSC
MGDQEPVHEIFLTDPTEQLKYIDKNVRLVLVTGDVLIGTVYTIDPVSQSIVLTVGNNETSKPTVTVVMKHAIQSMEFALDGKPNLNVILEEILTTGETSTSTKCLKAEVKRWLEKNMIPVIEQADILKIDNLEIHPPYGPDQCFSGNPIVLLRVQGLLRQMPMTNNKE